MAELRKWPMALNQPGYDYPAELFRAQYYGSTSGGNGVSDPGALKVTAQPAPDGTVSIVPGGAYARSTYAGASGQSYYTHNFQPFTLTIPPTGSASDGRHDLVILRVCDPQYDQHPDHPGGEISEEEAANYDFWWFEIHQGRAVRTAFDFPHVKLAHIRRGANQTIVRPQDIYDLRELANPKTAVHPHALNMPAGTNQSVHTGSTVWPTLSTHTAHIPEFATQAKVIAGWNQLHAHREAGSAAPAHGNARIGLSLGGETIYTQQTHWNTTGDQNFERFGIALADTVSIPEHFRGEDVTVQFFATKYPGPNAYVDSNSSTSLTLFFEQGVV